MTRSNKNWEDKFIGVLKTIHRRNLLKKTKRVLKKITVAKSSMVSRSKKYNVACTITVDDLRELVLSSYGTKCKFSGRILTVDNMVFDHIIPISRGGPSTKDNIQLISKFSNNMKGALMEIHFRTLLEWLQTVPDELRNDVSIRLAGGKSYVNRKPQHKEKS